MGNIKAVFDHDEVITKNHLDELCLFHNKEFGTNLSRNDFYYYNFGEILKVPEPIAVERYYDFYINGHALKIEFDPKAIQLLRKLYEKEIELYILSSKQFDFYKHTADKLINEIGPIFQDVIFTNEHLSDIRNNGLPSTTKAEVLRMLKPDYFVDDLPSHIEKSSLTSPSTHFILYGDYKWNQKIYLNESNVKLSRASNMDEVEKIILNGKSSLPYNKI